MLMKKVRYSGDDWTDKHNLKEIYVAQKQVQEEFVDVVSYFGGVRLAQIEDSDLRLSTFFKKPPA